MYIIKEYTLNHIYGLILCFFCYQGFSQFRGWLLQVVSRYVKQSTIWRSVFVFSRLEIENIDASVYIDRIPHFV